MNKILIVLFCIANNLLHAQDYPKWMINPSIGIDLGAVIPYPTSKIPDGAKFTPKVTPSFGISFQYTLHPKWNVGLDINHHTLAFKGNANVVSQPFWSDDREYVFYFTGEAKTNVKLQFIEIPLSFYYRLSPKSSLVLGLYFSKILKGRFDTEGNKGWISASKEDTDNAPLPGKQHTRYSFSDNLTSTDFGVLLGYQYQIHKRFLLSGKLNLGLKSIFKPEFQNLDYEMYQFRANISAAYILFQNKK